MFLCVKKPPKLWTAIPGNTRSEFLRCQSSHLWQQTRSLCLLQACVAIYCSKRGAFIRVRRFLMELPTRFELVTSSLPRTRSAAWAMEASVDFTGVSGLSKSCFSLNCYRTPLHLLQFRHCLLILTKDALYRLSYSSIYIITRKPIALFSIAWHG